MMRLRFFAAVLWLALAASAGAEAQTAGAETAGPRALKSYFSGTGGLGEPARALTQKLFLYGGVSVYREVKEKAMPPFSSFVFAFEQRLREFPKIGDLSLQIGVHSAKLLAGGRATAVELGPRFSLPSGKNSFPFYTGAGMGLGVFPRHIIKSKPALSFNFQMFAGLRFADLYENLGCLFELNLQMRAPFSDLQIYLDALLLGGLLFSF